MASTLVKVYLLDNSYKSIAIDDKTTVGTFLVDCCKKFDVNELHAALFSLFEVTKAGQKIIQLHKKLKPIVSAWEGRAEDKENKLLFKMSLFVSSLYGTVDAISPGEIRLLYLYAASLFINGYYPVTIDEAIYLGGLRMQLILGDYKRNIHGPMFQQSPQKLMSFIPQSLHGAKKQNEWEKVMIQSYQKNSGKSTAAAEKEYFTYMMKKSYFGKKIYYATAKSSKQHSIKGKLACGIGSEGITLFKEKNLDEVITHFELAKITHFGHSQSSISFDYGSSVSYTLDTKKSQEIISVLQIFIDLMMKLKKQLQFSRKSTVLRRTSSATTLPLKSVQQNFAAGTELSPRNGSPGGSSLSKQSSLSAIPSVVPVPSGAAPDVDTPQPNASTADNLQSIHGMDLPEPINEGGMPAKKPEPKDGSESMRVQTEGNATTGDNNVNIENQLLDFDDPIVFGRVLDTRPPDQDDLMASSRDFESLDVNPIDILSSMEHLDKKFALRPVVDDIKDRAIIPGPESPLVHDTVKRLEKEKTVKYLENFLLVQPDPSELVDLSIMLGGDVAPRIQPAQVELYNKLLYQPDRDDLVSKNIIQEYPEQGEHVKAVENLKQIPLRTPIAMISTDAPGKPAAAPLASPTGAGGAFAPTKPPPVPGAPPVVSPSAISPRASRGFTRMASSFDLSKPPPIVPAKPKPAFDTSKPPPVVPAKPKPAFNFSRPPPGLPQVPVAPKPNVPPAAAAAALPAKPVVAPVVPEKAKPVVPAAPKEEKPEEKEEAADSDDGFFDENDEGYEEPPPRPEEESPSDMPKIDEPEMPEYIKMFLGAIGLA